MKKFYLEYVADKEYKIKALDRYLLRYTNYELIRAQNEIDNFYCWTFDGENHDVYVSSNMGQTWEHTRFLQTLTCLITRNVFHYNENIYNSLISHSECLSRVNNIVYNAVLSLAILT